MCYGQQPLNNTTRHPRHCSSGIHPLQHSHEACSREGGEWESSFWGMLKKAASGVLALFPCSRTEYTLRASKGLRPCWTDFFNHSPPLLTSIVCRAFTCHRREIFNRPLFEFPDYTSGEFLNRKSWGQADRAKGLSIGGGDCPKACQVSSLACKAPCSRCLELVVITENISGGFSGLMTTTPLGQPEI